MTSTSTGLIAHVGQSARRLSPMLLAAPLLALSALLPADSRLLCALLAIIVLGVPHGALDGEVARDVVRPRFGRTWFLVFSLPYLTLSALVLLAWHAAPLWTLAGFLAASVWHFGSEDAAAGSLIDKLVRGGLPIAVPTLVHPAATALVFATVAGQRFDGPPLWLEVGAIAWAALAAFWALRIVICRHGDWMPVVALVLVFVVLPPITAFAIYFVCVHAPAHTAELIGSTVRGRRVQSQRSALLLALPICGLTLLLGVMLWPFYVGMVPDRLLALTLQGLAALTLPHMMLDLWLSRHEAAQTQTGHRAS
ncbi:Brp/Blh family beta-carotene 15,15'-dioxygenase [Lichenihabitans psoromatis]|uniref:Brp/Blh family beta-carotene 15,15'-dioxygenase n=1 Tax=Lichenihabitans psoromatis TaxID=2528642 RepID=UPI001FDED651|nr:Brp/Blh family beta-carotene 15,15'-dioxygenase [Lichenihabitans psoromatis]